MTKVEIRVMQLQAKEHQRSPVIHQKLGRGKEAFSLMGLKGAWTYQQLDFRLVASRTEIINFCCVKPPSVWYFVVVVLGNIYRC